MNKILVITVIIIFYQRKLYLIKILFERSQILQIKINAWPALSIYSDSREGPERGPNLIFPWDRGGYTPLLPTL